MIRATLALVAPLAGLAQSQEPAPAPATAPTAAAPAAQGPIAPVLLTATDRMDPEVLALIGERVAAVEAANEALAAAEGEAVAAAVSTAGQAHAELGLAYEANTMWTPALATYGHAIALLPESPEWIFRKGVCQVSLGEPQAALESFRVVAEKLSGTAVVQARLGATALLLGNVDEAEKAWLAAIASEAKLEGELKFAESRVGLAQVRYDQDDLESAEALLREALGLNPGYGHAHHLLGLVLAEQGRDDEAEFELAVGKNSWPAFPPDPHGPRLSAYSAGYGRRMMGVENMMQMGQIPQALEALQGLAAERPNDHFVLNLTARGLTMMGRMDEAYQALATSEQVNPGAQDTKVELAVNLVNRAGQTQDPEARANMMAEASVKIVEAINIAPLRGRPWYFRGLIEMQRIPQVDPQADPQGAQAAQQAMQAATGYLQRAHKLGCQEPQLYERLAQVYFQMGRTGEMLKFAQESAERSPQNPNSWVFLARAALTVQDFDGALVALKRAETLAASNPQLAQQVAQFGAAMRQEIDKQRAAAEQPAPTPDAQPKPADDK